jgi:hypothetical protein
MFKLALATSVKALDLFLARAGLMIVRAQQRLRYLLLHLTHGEELPLKQHDTWWSAGSQDLETT